MLVDQGPIDEQIHGTMHVNKGPKGKKIPGIMQVDQGPTGLAEYCWQGQDSVCSSSMLPRSLHPVSSKKIY
jgi:hypothetical protein